MNGRKAGTQPCSEPTTTAKQEPEVGKVELGVGMKWRVAPGWALSGWPCTRSSESLTMMISVVFQTSWGRPKAKQKALECARVDS